MKFRLILISCVLSIIPLFIFQVYYYYSTERIIYDGQKKSNVSETRNSAEDIGDKINTSVDTLSLFAQLTLPKVSIEFNRPEALNEFLSTSNEKHQLFERLVVLDHRFEFFASSNSAADIISLIEGNQDFKNVAKELFAKEQTEISYASKIGNDQSLSFFVATKIFDESGKIIGYFVGQISNVLLDNSVERLKSRIKSSNAKNINISIKQNGVGNDLVCSPIIVKGVSKAQLCIGPLKSEVTSWIQKNILILLSTVIVLAAAYGLIYQFFIGRILSPLYQFLKNLTKITEGNFLRQSENSNYSEINSLISSTNSIVEKLKASQEQEIEKVRIEAVAKVATQAAHDIRSPLEVLKSLKDEMDHFPDSTRKRIQLSVNRIEEITFNLLEKHKESVGITIKFNSEELLGILSSVVSEKIFEYRNFELFEIHDNFSPACYGIFSNIERGSFKSIISNLINNASESLDAKKVSVTVELTSSKEVNIIKIIDNGPGISVEVAKKLFTKGFTTKKTGNGLGLFNARQDIQAVGGTIGCESEVGKGTTFTISLPKSEAPAIFIGSIDEYKYERIIVLDDDPAFHEIWRKRLAGFGSKVEHIHSIEEMLSKYQALSPNILLLSDFELMDKQLDGIDTILKLGHSEHSVLVTARNEEKSIQDRCLAAGIKLLPKSLVNYVKVVKENPASFKVGSSGEGNGEYFEGGVSFAGAGLQLTSEAQDTKAQTSIVLIDDDRLIHLNWNSYCKNNGFQFHGFKSIAQFIAFSAGIDKDSKIYIDSNLGDGIKGEIESEKIFALGFFNLYLATGYEKGSIAKPSWIKEIYSKSPENIV